jgi:hypothetical protein
MADPEREKHALLLEESRRMLDKQLEQIDAINAKAHRLLRVVLILIGFIVTAVGFAFRGEGGGAMRHLVTANTVVGALLLVLSSSVAVITYVDRRYPAGVSKEGIEEGLAIDEIGALEREVIASYKRCIRRTALVNSRDGAWITATNLLLVSAILFLAGGAAVGAVDALHAPGWRLALALDGGVLLVNLVAVTTIAYALGFDPGIGADAGRGSLAVRRRPRRSRGPHRMTGSASIRGHQSINGRAPYGSSP